MRRALAVVGVAVALLLVAGPAQAHNYLVASSPVAGTTLTELPEEFSITTNDVLLDLTSDHSGFALQVQDAAGRYYGDGCVSVDGPTMSADPALGEPGDYSVTWQIVSTDGHTVSDSFTFVWQPTGETEPSPGSAVAPTCGVAAPATSATPTPPASSAPDRPADDGTLATVLWIGGAVLVVVIAVVATVLLLGRRKPE